MPPAIRAEHYSPRGAVSDAASPVHTCSANWSLRLSCASATLFMRFRGTLNWRLHWVQTPMAGTAPNHLTTLRLRFTPRPPRYLDHSSSRNRFRYRRVCRPDLSRTAGRRGCPTLARSVRKSGRHGRKQRRLLIHSKRTAGRAWNLSRPAQQRFQPTFNSQPWCDSSIPR